jgi:cephalosporin hydroxylase
MSSLPSIQTIPTVKPLKSRTLTFAGVGVVCVAGLIGLYQVRRNVVSAATPALATAFHHAYYNSLVSNVETRWMGHTVQKTPFDLWTMQEIIVEKKPDLIIETGTHKGGSAQFFGSVLEMLGHGRMITVDIEAFPEVVKHPRVEYLIGSSTAPEIVAKIRQSIQPGDKVMVLLDSDHRYQHVINELKLYASMVTPGQYLIVEDTNLNGNPVHREFGPGPMEAVKEFLGGTSEFQVDTAREQKFQMTYNPSGYLLRK